MQIVEIQLRHFQAILDPRRLTLKATDAAKDWLAEKGFSPDFGARPLKRLIQKEVQDPLAREILQGSFAPGDVVTLDAAADGLVLKKGDAEEATAG